MCFLVFWFSGVGHELAGDTAHLVWSLAVIVLVNIIRNGVDIERAHNFCAWEALLDCVVHACMPMLPC